MKLSKIFFIFIFLFCNCREISFSVNRDDEGNITGINFHITGKIIDEAGNLSKEELQTKRNNIINGFKNIKVEGGNVTFSGDISIANSESDLSKTDHAFRIVDDIRNVPGNGHNDPKTKPIGFSPIGQNVIYLDKDFDSRTAAHETFVHSAGLYHIFDGYGGQPLYRYNPGAYADAKSGVRNPQYDSVEQKAHLDGALFSRNTLSLGDFPGNLSYQSSIKDSAGNSLAGYKMTKIQVQSIIYNISNGKINKGNQKSN